MASADDHIEEVVGVLIELPDTEGSTLLRAERVLAAMAVLREAGFTLVLLPVGEGFGREGSPDIAGGGVPDGGGTHMLSRNAEPEEVVVCAACRTIP